MALVIAKTLVVIGHFPIGTKVEVIEEEMDLRTKKQYSLVVPLGTSKQIRVESKHIFYTYVKRIS